MKRIIAILVMLMLVPFTAFGLEALSEDVMDNVTGQAGVSIAVDVNVDMHMDTLAWGDSDGLGAGTSEGWVGLSDFNMDNLRIRLDSHQFGALKLFTIDVATATADTAAVVYDRTSGAFVARTDGVNLRAANTTFVRLGLGSMLITMDEMTAEVELAGTATGLDDSQMMGDFAMHDFAMTVNSMSYVDISSHGDAGVTIDLAVKINSITIGAISWGDADGLGAPAATGNTYNDGIGDAYGLADMPVGHNHTPSSLVGDATNTSAAYIGLRDMEIRNLVVTGQVMIDVATIEAGTATPGTVSWVYTTIQAQNPGDGMSNSAVVIRLNDMYIGMDSFKADVALSNASDLGYVVGGSTTDRTNAVMGSIYMENMDVNVNGWVAIGAH